MTEIVGPNEGYKLDGLWSNPPFIQLSGIADQWAKSCVQQEGHMTIPLDLARINDETFSVHKSEGFRDSQSEAEKLLALIHRLSQRDSISAHRNFKVGSTPQGDWEVYWEVESPFDHSTIEDIRNKYGDYIVSLFELDDQGLNFTHSAGFGKNEPNSLKGRFAINKRGNAGIILVEMVQENRYNHLLVPKLNATQPHVMREAQELWHTFIVSLGTKIFTDYKINGKTDLFIHAQPPDSSTNNFVAEFSGLYA